MATWTGCNSMNMNSAVGFGVGWHDQCCGTADWNSTGFVAAVGASAAGVDAWGLGHTMRR